MKSLSIFALTLLCTSAIVAQEKPQAYIGAQIITVAGPVIDNGVLVVHRGKILAVGRRGEVNIPADAQTRDVAGRVIMPGLIDTHSHIGGASGADGSSSIQPDVRVMDSFNARDTGLKRALAGGITTVNVMPGSGHLLSGQTLYLKLRNKFTIDDLLIRDSQGNIAGGIKMANGTNSIRPAPPAPGTRAKSVALVREMFLKAQDYRDKVRKAAGDRERVPPRDLAMEAMMDVLDGKRIVHFHTHRHDDIMTVIRLAKEFNFRVVLQHVSEGWKVADEIAKAGVVGSSIIVIDSPGGKIEALDNSFRTGGALERAGAVVGFHTDDYITDSRLFLRSAALAVRAGMSREKALYGLTMAGAIMLDLQKQTGSLEAGKDADFIILSGDPLSVYTKVLETHVEGVRVFDLSNPADRLFAVGGYAARRDHVVHTDEWEENE